MSSLREIDADQPQTYWSARSTRYASDSILLKPVGSNRLDRVLSRAVAAVCLGPSIHLLHRSNGCSHPLELMILALFGLSQPELRRSPKPVANPGAIPKDV
jgi:hypothetical protein